MKLNNDREIADAFEYFGLKPGASSDEVKRRHLALAVKWHPDKHNGDRVAEQAMKQINAARDVLLAHVMGADARSEPVADPTPSPPQPRPSPASDPSASAPRDADAEIAAFVERAIGRAYQACADGSYNAKLFDEVHRQWVDHVLPEVQSRWGVRLCRWVKCLRRPADAETLCEEHRRIVNEDDDGHHDEPLCRGETRDGAACLNRARPGNYGFCGRHRSTGVAPGADWCRADNRDGSVCTSRALPGNYGFCGRHRRK